MSIIVQEINPKTAPVTLKIYNCIKDFKLVKNTVVTIGTFDGVHLGHQSIFNKFQESLDVLSQGTVCCYFDDCILNLKDAVWYPCNFFGVRCSVLCCCGVSFISISMFLLCQTQHNNKGNWFVPMQKLGGAHGW